MPARRLIGAGFILAVAVLVAVGIWQTSRSRPARWAAVVRHPQRVMGTTCTLAAVAEANDRARAEQALDDAEAALRQVEARMSIWLSDSEVSRLNAAGVGEEVALAADTLHVLHVARDAARATMGAFDITIQPVISLWRRAGEHGELPTDAAVADARGASNWDAIELNEAGARKLSPRAAVDLGGIAKGHAVDQAIGILQAAGLTGALVDVGGDLRCFGRSPEGDEWSVEIRSPFEDEILGKLNMEDGAVCTSGNYARFTAIEGERYSHVIDPRTGWPADAAPSVTVVAPNALTADIWATALSVLGSDGLALLPETADALMVLGDERDYRLICTPRMRGLLQEQPERLTVWQRSESPEVPELAPTPATPSRQRSS